MVWLVTGGYGQLGVSLCHELDRRNISYRSCSSKELDISQRQVVSDFISKVSPKVIINCAAWTNVERAEIDEASAAKVNTNGAENLAIAASDCGAKLIQISTDYVFSGDTKTSWKVDDDINPQTAYGRTKAAGEIAVLRTYPGGSLIVRTAWLYSPWGKNFVKTMVNLSLYSYGEVKVVNDQIGQPTSAIDLGKLIVDLASSKIQSGIYHGTNSGQATWFEFAQEIFHLAGADKNRVIPVQTGAYPSEVNRPINSVLSHDAWAGSIVSPMRDWRNALREALPGIISEVRGKGNQNENHST